jgi:MFS family permease
MTGVTRRRPDPRTSAGRWFGDLPRLFWMLWAGILINRLGTLIEPFLGVYLIAVRGFSVAAAGAVLAIYALGSMASQILGGWLADRLGRRATLTVGMLANGASLIALGYTTAAPAVIAMTFAAGATIDMYRPAAQALVADLIPAAERARAYGLISWAANLGFSAAMLAGGMLAQTGFRWLFWADALTCVAFAALAWRALPAAPARAVAQATQPRGFADVLHDRVMAGFMLVVLGQTIVYQQGFTTLPIAMHAAGFPPRGYGLVMALNGIVIVIVQPLAGTWLGRHDQGLVIVAGNVLLGAARVGAGIWVRAAVPIAAWPVSAEPQSDVRRGGCCLAWMGAVLRPPACLGGASHRVRRRRGDRAVGGAATPGPLRRRLPGLLDGGSSLGAARAGRREGCAAGP